LGGVRRFIDEVREAADEWQVEINAIESAGEGRVLLRMPLALPPAAP